jgi:hypothetical protein
MIVAAKFIALVFLFFLFCFFLFYFFSPMTAGGQGEGGELRAVRQIHDKVRTAPPRSHFKIPLIIIIII